jgi:hypothetical protein
MNLVALGVLGVAALVDLACWGLMLAQIFTRESVWKGLWGILCGVYAFHYGWRHAVGWDLQRAERDQKPVHKRFMLVWTCATVVLLFARFL